MGEIIKFEKLKNKVVDKGKGKDDKSKIESEDLYEELDKKYGLKNGTSRFIHNNFFGDIDMSLLEGLSDEQIGQLWVEITELMMDHRDRIVEENKIANKNR